MLSLLSLLALVAPSQAALSDFTRLPDTDVTPCVPPCVRVGGCGNYAPNPNGDCNITWLAEQCTATYGCVAFNSNGWLKGCGNVSCGVTFEGSSVDTYVNTSSGGVPPPPLPCPTAVPVEDEHYPSEEPLEAAGSPPPALLSAGPTWALLRQGGSSVNTTVGAWAFGFQLVSTLGSGSLAVLERTFARWGFLVFLSAASGEVARLRKGVGQAQGLVMPVYSYLAEDPCGYYQTVYNNATDYLAARIAADTPDGEATFLAAIKYLPPQRDYASIGAIEPYAKFSVSPDGRIKTADSDIYTTSSVANETGPGVLVFDPAVHLGAGVWPATNWTFTKSALVGGFLRVVAVVGVSYDSGAGFEQLAFAPASEPAASAYIRLRSSLDGEWGAFAYYNASASTPLAPLEEGAFYAALLAESQLWNATLAGAAAYSLPGREGARQVDTATASLVASMSLYVGLQPNYGDGADYWSPQVDRGGSLPFQEIAVVQNLLDIGLAGPAADRLGWWLDNYIKADGQISTGDWEDSCPGGFADGLADYGEMQDIFVRTARAALAQSPNGTAWLAAHMGQGWRLMNYSYHLRLAAVARGEGSGNATKGMIWGSPEHDTCHSPDYYYHNNAWFLRGMLESGKFLRDVCAVEAVCTALAPQGAVLLAEAERYRADLLASLALSVTFAGDGTPLFIPPIAAPAYHPFASMIESTVAMYSNFRYFAELLGADVLPPAMSAALQDFRETHQGTVSGITRWSDHLDDMPSSVSGGGHFLAGHAHTQTTRTTYTHTPEHAYTYSLSLSLSLYLSLSLSLSTVLCCSVSAR